jgi:hypothetical protein
MGRQSEELTDALFVALHVSLQPGEFQQTLIRSFALGGIGLHTGDYGKLVLKHRGVLHM